MRTLFNKHLLNAALKAGILFQNGNNIVLNKHMRGDQNVRGKKSCHRLINRAGITALYTASQM